MNGNCLLGRTDRRTQRRGLLVARHGDLNGDDGLSDIVWQFDNGQAGVWTMNGTTIVRRGHRRREKRLPVPGARRSRPERRRQDGPRLADMTNGQAVGFLMNGASIIGAGNIGAANGADWLVV